MAEAWTARDSVLFAICQIAADAVAGQLDRRPRLAHTFALQFAPDEQLLASGAYSWRWFGAAGDGTYESRSFLMGGRGVLGAGLLGATAIASAAGNSSRRNHARADAALMWRPGDQGAIHISSYGFYLHGPLGFRSFGWHHVLEGDLIFQTGFQLTANTTDGTGSFQLVSDWSELVFVLWALAMNPHHPRIVFSSWLDPGFVEKCRRFGCPVAIAG